MVFASEPDPLVAESYSSARHLIEEKRYWAECKIAAELQTCDPADVPGSREEVREYYAAMRPRLCLSENARELIHYFLRSERKIAGTGLWAGSHLMSQATIATIPKWMRELGGFDQTAAIDKAILPLARAGVIAAQQPLVVRPVLKALAPSTLPVMEQVMSGVQPLNDELLTPTEAKKRYGSKTAKQAA